MPLVCRFLLLLLFGFGRPSFAQTSASGDTTGGEDNFSLAAVPSVSAAPSVVEDGSHATSLPAAATDFRWLSGNGGPSTRPLTAGPLTLELRVDTAAHYSFARPIDNTIGGSSEVFRHGELQLTHVGFGGEVDFKNVQARVLLQLGLYAQTTQRNDASPARGQWQLDQALRHLSEAYVGYHFDFLSGVNVQAGLFMSYIGLWSYYNFDNWTYQPSFVSSNTPWFFNGIRAQVMLSPKLKLEPYLVNGWQAYGRFNAAPGVGLQALWRPREDWSLVTNAYFGTDTLGNAARKRFHSDSSVLHRYLHRPGGKVSKAAVSLTLDGGFESGGGVTSHDQHFLGAMAYHRLWFCGDRLGLTLGGGLMKNPGRYLVLLPPVNGATAFSGTPAFTANPKDPYFAWDAQASFDWTPSPFVIFRWEYTYRYASVPYFSGRGGVTPPGGNAGAPGSSVANWSPDLRRQENRLTFAMMLKM